VGTRILATVCRAGPLVPASPVPGALMPQFGSQWGQRGRSSSSSAATPSPPQCGVPWSTNPTMQP